MAINLPSVKAKFVNELGQATQVFFRALSEIFAFVNNQPVTLSSTGSPEGVVSGRFKDLYWDTLNDQLNFKSSSTGITGWVAIN